MRIRTAVMVPWLAIAASAGAAYAQMSIVNGASFQPGQPMAPGAFATVFGHNLCPQTAKGDWIAPGQLPTSLGGCSVTVNGMPAMMSFASPDQINFIVPSNMGPGTANVTVNSGAGMLSGTMMGGLAGPGVFGLNGMGMGDGAALHGTLWQPGPFSATSNGQPTPVSIYMTGLDLSTKPMVLIGGMPADVTFFGPAPGYAGLQQVNIMLPAGMAGAGRAPMTVTSNGQTSNVTFMNLLPTASMMLGMPGWGPGMMLGENMRRGREMSSMALNPVNGTALVADENDDAVRVISLDSKTVTGTVTLPSGSEARAIAVNAAGTMAAVALSAKSSVALIDLATKTVAVIGVGSYPGHLAFAGGSLLVSNAASGTVSMIDTASRGVTRTISVGFGPAGIAVAGNLAVVANMQAGSVSLINLTTYSVTNVDLPAGSRPYEVAISSSNKAVVTTPMSNGFLILDLATKQFTTVATDVWNAMGPGAVAINGNLAYIANQMTASVTVVDLAAAKVLKTFPVDPGPRSLAVHPAKNQLLVLAQGTGVLDVVDLNSYAITARIDAGGSQRVGVWTLPLISSVAPNTAAAGATINLVVAGSNLQSVKDLEFHQLGGSGFGMGGGMMSGEDSNVKVTNLQVNQAGTQITARVQILPAATPGVRQIRLETDRGEVMGMTGYSLFTITR